MINRVSDINIISNDSFEKLAKIIKEKGSKKLYRICSNNEDAAIAIKELKVQGYNSKVEKLGNNINVYKVIPEMIELNAAEQTNNFKKLAWGRYCFQRNSSINGFEEYNFDDGSIWRVVVGEDGKEYLVKDVDDNDEDKVLRTKTASLTKKAAAYTNDSTISNIIKIVYGTDINPQFLSDLTLSSLKQDLFSLLDEKINTLVTEATQQKNIVDQNVINDLQEYISTNMTNNTITDSNSFSNVLNNRIDEIVKAMEIL